MVHFDVDREGLTPLSEVCGRLPALHQVTLSIEETGDPRCEVRPGQDVDVHEIDPGCGAEGHQPPFQHDDPFPQGLNPVPQLLELGARREDPLELDGRDGMEDGGRVAFNPGRQRHRAPLGLEEQLPSVDRNVGWRLPAGGQYLDGPGPES